MTVAASTNLHEPYRLNREKKARGLVRREVDEREEEGRYVEKKLKDGAHCSRK